MGLSAAARTVLMSIRPKYAHAIFEGTKRVEFRKRRLADDVTHVVVYSTSPEQRVLGIFVVEGQHTMSPKALWEEFSGVGNIDREAFFRYYENREEAVGIRVGSVHRLPRPLRLEEDLGVGNAPQSYRYLGKESMSRLMALI